MRRCRQSVRAARWSGSRGPITCSSEDERDLRRLGRLSRMSPDELPYHVRDAERLRRKHGRRCTIWGHEACASRLAKRTGFHAITPQSELPAGVRAHAIGSPRRQEQPLWIPSHKALAFGDAVIETGGRLRVWEDDLDSEQRTRWYRDRFIPTLKPLLDLGPERVLVTHGDPVLNDGRAKLSSALRSKPRNRRGGG